jgi:hypothetical protein
MRYPEFRKKNLFVDSGVIEAGCKTVIGSRLKQSGMFWTVRSANAIIVACSMAASKTIGRHVEPPDYESLLTISMSRTRRLLDGTSSRMIMNRY